LSTITVLAFYFQSIAESTVERDDDIGYRPRQQTFSWHRMFDILAPRDEVIIK
jgi:hypothetical protein